MPSASPTVLRLVDRFAGTRMLAVPGALMTIVSVVLLLLPPETPLRILAGFLGGAGGAFVITPVRVRGGKPAGPPPGAEPTRTNVPRWRPARA